MTLYLMRLSCSFKTDDLRAFKPFECFTKIIVGVTQSALYAFIDNDQIPGCFHVPVSFYCLSQIEEVAYRGL
jgi:hypothetical protein